MKIVIKTQIVIHIMEIVAAHSKLLMFQIQTIILLGQKILK
jgi:hypothetical protein